MSKILSYNEKANGNGGWFASKEYEDDEIKAIKDPNGGLSKSPKTAIPSPFAQMDLVKNAFLRLSQIANLDGAVYDRKLVSNALDVAQIFFEFDNYADMVKVIKWGKADIAPLIRDGVSPLLGDTLEMFLRQDEKTNHFDRMDSLYFLSYKGEIVGGTSPASLFIATPNVSDESLDEKYGGLKIGDNDIFSHWQPLYKRDKDFIFYMYYLFAAFEELNVLDEVRKYLQTNFMLLKKNNPQLHQEIEAAGLDPGKQAGNRDELRESIEEIYDLLDNGVSVLGIPLYKKKKASQKEAIQKSNFLMRPTYIPKDEDIPLVLPNSNLNSVASDPFLYVGNTQWRDSDEMKEAIKKGSKDKLPNTNYNYPWRSAKHFFTESLIQLMFPINDKCFFGGNMNVGNSKEARNGYLLPLKEEYFRYFSTADLRDMLNGKKCFELEQKGEGEDMQVTVTLRIPISKGNGARSITLTRIYKKRNNTYNGSNDEGAIIELPFSLSIFPFARAKNESNRYNIQSIKQNRGIYSKYETKLSFYKDGNKEPAKNKESIRQTTDEEGGVRTHYYTLKDDIDYIRISLGGSDSHEGIVIPRWNEHKSGKESAFTFAVDFGTTNTHVEVMKGNEDASDALRFKASEKILVATLYNPTSNNPIFSAPLKQEFLPIDMDRNYGFPQRTIISEKSGLKGGQLSPLENVNIPFIYEKEDTGLDNKIIPNLKWNKEYEAHAKAYIEELVMLLRAKVLIDGGNLRETKIIWFYPQSMQSGRIATLHTAWEDAYKKYINHGGGEAKASVYEMSESLAPYYYYSKLSEFAGSTLVSIDIGGGTSDIVIIGKDSKPIRMTSIRFAANVLFGDGFEEAQADHNPMLLKYYKEFSERLQTGDKEYGELKKILDNIWQNKHSEDVNAFLFSIANSSVVEDKDAFSYNTMLSLDEERKVIFIYFYATLIYYIAKFMLYHGVEMPKAIMFSGTGSKVLDIIGRQKQLNELTQDLLEAIFEKKYDADGYFSVVLERKEPKQITCKGGLRQFKNNKKTIEEANDENRRTEKKIRTNFYLLPGREKLTYKDMQSEEVLDAIVDEVQKFNEFFIHFCKERDIEDAFALDKESYRIFTEKVGLNLKNFLVAGWKFVNRGNDLSKGGEDTVEDAPFLYPIIGSIRKNLINNIGKKEQSNN
jgi:hypothetical protein